MEYYAHREDAHIDRDEARADLMDNEGHLLTSFPTEWTDEQIFRALDFANRVYDIGVRTGSSRKANEIKAALEL